MQYLAIDVGGTTTKYGLVSATGVLSQQGEQPTMRASLADFMASLTGLILSTVRGDLVVTVSKRQLLSTLFFVIVPAKGRKHKSSV